MFGDYVDTYTIRQAVEDGSTVPIHYEARLARIRLAEDEKPKVDDEFEEVTSVKSNATSWENDGCGSSSSESRSL